jgi:hypothetical protein
LKAGNQERMGRYGLPSLFSFQYNIITRIDDTCQYLVSNLTSTPDFDFVLHSKLNSSMHVDEESDAPNQIMFGAMDYHYCTLLVLAVQIEIFLGSAGQQDGLTSYVFGFSEDITVPVSDEKKMTRYSQFYMTGFLS